MERNGRIFVDRLLPAALGDEPDARFSARLLAISLAVAAPSFAFLCFAHIQAGNHLLAVAQATASLLALGLLLAVSRGLARVPIAHTLILLVTAQVCLVSVLYGGVKVTALSFFAVTPLIALMIVGRRAALGWLAVGVALIFALHGAQLAGVPFPTPPPDNHWVDAISQTILAVVVVTLAASHATLSARALAALRAANQELSRSRAAAEQANVAKDHLVAMVSHELRTPLTGAIGFARLLNDAKLATPYAEYARAALASGETLLALVNDILDRARLSGGVLELQRIAFDLHRVLDETVRVGAVSAGEKDVQIILDADAPRWVSGDPVRLKQVLLNLIGNAVKFTAEGSVTLRVAPVDDKLRFSVVDTGMGIPDEVIARLFRPFAQGDVATTQRYGGSGLGLAIAKEIVERMGGSIQVASDVGQGSTFWFDAELPTTVGPTAGAASSERRLPLRLRVLVVDDNAVNRLLAVRFLEMLGATGVPVASGQAALSALKEARYDAVLLDCQMPEMDGFEVARRVRASETAGHHVPLVALTASALPEDRELALAAGMDDLITKPFDPEQLAERLSALVPRQPDSENHPG